MSAHLCCPPDGRRPPCRQRSSQHSSARLHAIVPHRQAIDSGQQASRLRIYLIMRKYSQVKDGNQLLTPTKTYRRRIAFFAAQSSYSNIWIFDCRCVIYVPGSRPHAHVCTTRAVGNRCMSGGATAPRATRSGTFDRMGRTGFIAAVNEWATNKRMRALH